MANSRAWALGVLLTFAATAAAHADPLDWTTSTAASATAPSATAASATAPSAGAGGIANAFINLGTGSYPGSTILATGNPSPWYDSAPVARLFGGTPTAQQIQSFDQAVMQDVQTTFQLSGINNVSLTDNPSVQAAHTLSLVSSASSLAFPGAIGTTDLGANGFSFIDPIAQASQSVNQLEWIVAHNISHELMLAFGVPENFDQTGNYVDARMANFAMMISPTSTFSSGAAHAISQKLAPAGLMQVLQPGAQLIAPEAATPEPTTVLLWGTLSVAAVAAGRRRRRPA